MMRFVLTILRGKRCSTYTVVTQAHEVVQMTVVVRAFKE